MDKIFRLTKVTKFSAGDENFVQRKILSHIVLSDNVGLSYFCDREIVDILSGTVDSNLVVNLKIPHR